MARLGELPNVLYATVLGKQSAKTIWRTVVFAGAMLGGAACGGKSGSSTTPEPAPQAAPEPAPATEPTPAPTEATTPMPAAGMANDPGSNPCGAPADPCAPAEAKPVEPVDETAKTEAKDAKGKKKPRPRANTESRPKGRGFVLS